MLSKRKKDNQISFECALNRTPEPPKKCIIEDESIVWIVLWLLQVREDNEEDGTGTEPLTWNQICGVLVQQQKK